MNLFKGLKQGIGNYPGLVTTLARGGKFEISELSQRIRDYLNPATLIKGGEFSKCPEYYMSVINQMGTVVLRMVDCYEEYGHSKRPKYASEENIRGEQALELITTNLQEWVLPSRDLKEFPFKAMHWQQAGLDKIGLFAKFSIHDITHILSMHVKEKRK